MRWLPLVGGLMLAAGGAQAQGLVGPFEPRQISAERWTESFSLIADLAGGVFLKVNQVVSNVGLGDGKAACRIVLQRPGAESKSWSDDFGDDWSFDPLAKSLRTGTCKVTNGPDGVRVEAQIEEVKVAIAYGSRARLVVSPEGVLSDGEAFYEYDVVVPWSTVEVQIETAGKVEKLVGFGFSDHSRATTLPRSIAYQWFRFLGIEQSGSLIFRVRSLNPGKDMVGWSWSQGEPRPMLKAPKISGFDEVPENHHFEFQVSLGNDVYSIVVEELVHDYAPLEELGMLGAMIRPWLGNPETKTYRARVRRGQREWRGLLEIATNYD